MAGGFSWEALMPDYSMAGMPEWVAYILSAVIGVTALVVLFRLFAASVRPYGGAR